VPTRKCGSSETPLVNVACTCPEMTSPTDCGVSRYGSLRLLGTNSALPPADAVSESRLAFRTRARGRGLRKVILPRASVEFFDLFDLSQREPQREPPTENRGWV
jgi:hypothetical protein